MDAKRRHQIIWHQIVHTASFGLFMLPALVELGSWTSNSKIARSQERNEKSIEVRNARAMGLRTAGVRIQIAANAPIIIANGGKEPIDLGATVSQQQTGDSLHIWDWSKSPTSRVLPEVELGPNLNSALTADGKSLVLAKGKILDLKTGKTQTIDLGGAVYKIDNTSYARIGDMRFSPTGNRLVMLVTSFVDGEPGHIKSELAQVVDFPGGNSIYEFEPDNSYALRIAFSTDGKHLVSADPSHHILMRDAASGGRIQQFEPACKWDVVAVAISPNNRYVAAYEGTVFRNHKTTDGNLFIWDAAFPDLLHCIDGRQLKKLGGGGAITGAMCFSPDSKYLAAESWGRIFVIEAASGEVANSLKQDVAAHIHWSADGKILAAITPALVGEGHHIYPSVCEWDWRQQRLIRKNGRDPKGE